MLRLVSLTTGLGKPVQAQLCLMKQRHVEDFEGIWQDILHELGQDDEFWNWAMKKRLSTADGRFEAYALEFEGLTQGLMWLETQWHRSWVNPAHQIVYVMSKLAICWLS